MPDRTFPDNGRKLSEALRTMAYALRSAGHHSCRAALFDAAAELDRLEAENTVLRDAGMVLSPAASVQFLEMLEHPPAPNEAIMELFRKHRIQVKSDV